jgi:deoxycytidine triphosphate deaminase
MQVSLEKFREEVTAKAGATLPTPEDRYKIFAEVDPYPKIPSTLLNSGHLASYAIAAGMIDQFEVDALEKPATYLVPIEGPVRFLDENGERRSFFLSDKSITGEADVRKEFELKPNSLCYVTLRPTFRMPAYIAGRFNLLIRDVYRGLLVGTGPLVDPGFEGQLSIPVHNFTSNKYMFRAGEGFVYFEFTKLAWKNPGSFKNPDWVPQPIMQQPPFPSSKRKRRTLDDYIEQATGGGPAQNAIQREITRVIQTSNKARSRINLISFGAIFGAVILLLTTIAAIAAAVQLYLGAQQFTQGAQSDISGSIEKLRVETQQLRSEINSLKQSRSAPQNPVAPRQ